MSGGLSFVGFARSLVDALRLVMNVTELRSNARFTTLELVLVTGY